MLPLIDYFNQIDDPRQSAKCRYNLSEVLFMATCAMLCGADDWKSIALFCKAREPWFCRHLALDNGIPSHDTFNRVFSLIDPAQFRRIYVKWTKSLLDGTGLSGTVAIDGKTVRGSAWNKGKDAIHMVNAWSSTLGISLGQEKVDSKSNEITAIPELLDLLELSGCLVSIDAMGCQRTIADKIRDKGADYLLAVKCNQGKLYNEIDKQFEAYCHSHPEDIESDQHSDASEAGHGRRDRRRCWVWHGAELGDEAKKWKAATVAAIQLDSERKSGTTTMLRFFISSRELSAAEVIRATREHWHVENSLHWVLDVAFDEDRSRARAGYAAENLATLRQLLLNLLKQNTEHKTGIKNKRKMCGWDADYMLRVLNVVA